MNPNRFASRRLSPNPDRDGGRRIAALRRRAQDERGFALAAAIIALLVIGALTAGAIAVSTKSSTTTTRDTRVKAELEAAEAGLQVATYRLSKLKPEASACINEEKAVLSACKDSPESLGNSATFQYWTTAALAAGASCAGRTVAASASLTQRCVTAEGLVAGVKPGVVLQALVAAKGGESLFSIKGILGLEQVKVSGSVKLPSVVGSNGKIIGEGSAAFESGYEICPGGRFTPAVGAERVASGVTVGGLKEDPRLERTRSASECPLTASLPAVHATASSNEDSRLTNKLDTFSASKYEWNETTHELTLKETALTLGGSKYFFCSFTGSHGSKLIIPATAKVEIFIGSSSESGSGCKSSAGTFTGEGSFKVENLAKDPADLLIMMGGAGPFTVKNGSTLEAAIYAPEALVAIDGGTTFRGGIVGEEVHLENGAGIFEWNEEVAGLTNGEPTAYSRGAWEQCPVAGC
jgi:Tfp pilus assembly protein PilX